MADKPFEVNHNNSKQLEALVNIVARLQDKDDDINDLQQQLGTAHEERKKLVTAGDDLVARVMGASENLVGGVVHVRNKDERLFRVTLDRRKRPPIEVTEIVAVGVPLPTAPQPSSPM